MEKNTIFANRISKNFKKLKKWLKQNSIEAYRIYDKDIPEIPYIIDIYLDHAVIWERGIKPNDDPAFSEKVAENQFMIKKVLSEVLEINTFHIKSRVKNKGKAQYEKQGSTKNFIQIIEGRAKFIVNLDDYLDTGIYLDHRPLRTYLSTTCKNKSVLNLFSYTGSFSVHCALGGANVTTVDMSNTYINWAIENFKLNEINPNQHKFISNDCLEYIKNCRDKFDIIILDPPSFSNSKKMDDIFDIQRDHVKLITNCMKLLNSNGTMYFSNNNRKFKLDPEILNSYRVKDITSITIPQDFRDKKIHVCFEIND